MLIVVGMTDLELEIVNFNFWAQHLNILALN